MSDQQKVEIPVPKSYSIAELKAIGQDVVDYIVKRTESGKDKNNKDFAGYSKSYIKSLNFKIAGKSPKRVDLTLSGDMLAALQVLDVEKGKIIIGYEDGDPINGRVEGHRTGLYGEHQAKKRDFLGITKTDLKSKILSNYDEESIDRSALLNEIVDVSTRIGANSRRG